MGKSSKKKGHPEKENKPTGAQERKKAPEAEKTGATKEIYVKRPREAQFELLRVVAMLMVITLHYLSHGGDLVQHAKGSVAYNISWILEALCLVSVNIYVMISGYFMPGSRFSLVKLLRLWCQIAFYSILIAAFMILFVVKPEDRGAYLNLFQLQYFCLPVTNQHYWFASCYLLLYVLSPLLNRGLEKLEKQQHVIIMLLMLGVYSLPKSFLPVVLTSDDAGYSLPWFIFLYLLANYIRRYGIPWLEGHKGRALLLYLTGALSVFVSREIFVSWNADHLTEGNVFTQAYNYNNLFVVLSCVGLFYCFKELKLKEKGLIKFIVRIAPYTFGVYLIHEHLMVRELWYGVLDGFIPSGVPRFFHGFSCVVIVFAAGILVDWLRALLFIPGEKLIRWGWKLYLSKKELFDYLIVGGITTVVAWVSYYIFSRYTFRFIADDVTSKMVSEAASWLLSTMFAYVTNRIFVFHSTKNKPGEILVECFQFVTARVVSFGVDELMFFLLLTVMHMNDILAKIIISVTVVVLNYIFSKLWVFKKK